MNGISLRQVSAGLGVDLKPFSVGRLYDSK